MMNDIVYDCCYNQRQKNECFASYANSNENLKYRNKECQKNAIIEHDVVDGIKVFWIKAITNIERNHEILVSYTLHDHIKFFDNNLDQALQHNNNTNNTNKHAAATPSPIKNKNNNNKNTNPNPNLLYIGLFIYFDIYLLCDKLLEGK